jgi:D-lactate dehydrogenase (cytochrome)
MSANYFARGLRPLGRSATAATTTFGNAAPATKPRFFNTSAFRRNTAGGNSGGKAGSGPAWTGQRVLAIAAAAGAVGWGLASIESGRFPGAMLLDSKVPKYASMREMELVRGFVSFFF